MSTLKSKLSEYFLGSETKKYHAYLKEFYKENFVDAEHTNRMLPLIDRHQSASLWAGTYLPNVTLALGVVNALLGQVPYFSALGEGCRIFSLYRRKKFKEETEASNQNLMAIIRLEKYLTALVETGKRNMEELQKRMEDLRKRNEEGEEWKRGIHKDYDPDNE